MTSIKNNSQWEINAAAVDQILASYDFHLPEDRIATRPKQVRDQSRLLVYEAKSEKIHHSIFENIGQFLPSESTFVLNQSKVFKARLLGKKATGGACEIFVLSLIDQNKNYNVMIKTSGQKKIGDEFYFDDFHATLTKIENDGTFWVTFSCKNLTESLQKSGLLPIPPYIRKGLADEQDELSYQTVFSKEIGSVAAPTAGLHFTDQLLQSLLAQNHHFTKVTLHVGAGTFMPVKVDNICDHRMHAEYFSIDQENSQKIQTHFNQLIPVGTTALRTIQSCIKNGQFVPPENSEFRATDIFLYPGQKIYGIQGLVTNFHLPKSTLLMLVSSLIGRQKTLDLYNLAIQENYRFFSYGDAMLILNK